MGDFRTVVIERDGGQFRLSQGGDALLRLPAGLLDRFSADAVFPPAWTALEPCHPVRRLFWNETSGEFLMTGLEDHPVRAIERLGASPYRSYVQGLWLPSPPLLLLRPYWNPPDPYAPFDGEARRESFRAQGRLCALLHRLRPPEGWTAVFNAVDDYLEALGVTVEGPGDEPEAVRELSLTPPAPLGEPEGRNALEALAVGEVGRAFPVVRGGALAGVHALDLGDLHRAEAVLAAAGLAYQVGPYRPH